MANGFPTKESFSYGEYLAASEMAAIGAAINESAPAKVTAAGDLLVGSAANTIARLAKGSNYEQLMMLAGAVAWGNPIELCKARRAGNQSIADSTDVTVQFTAEDIDTASFIDLTSDNTILTMPNTAYYLVMGMIQYGIGTGFRKVTIPEIPGAEVTQDAATGISTQVDIVVLTGKAAAATLTLQGRQGSGGTINIEAAWFAAVQLLRYT